MKYIDKIIVEWAYRVSDGMPDARNSAHQLILREVLEEFGGEISDINESLDNLNEESDAAKKAKALGLVSKGYGRWADPKTDKVVAQTVKGQLVPVGKKKVKKEPEKEPEKPKKAKKPKRKSDEEEWTPDSEKPVTLEDGDRKKLKELESREDDLDDEEKQQLKELRTKVDHAKSDKALTMTKKEYKELLARHKLLKKWKAIQVKLDKTPPKALNKTEKEFLKNNNLEGKKFTKKHLKEFEKLEEGGIGAGTGASQAGETATHKALRMLQEGKSIEQVEEYLMSIANDPNTVLDKGWARAGIAAARKINTIFGDRVKDISWDTPEGRQAIGVDPNFSTASDMFVTLEDGTKVGISLKKDGKVFINNGGWKEQHKNIRQSLKDAGLSETQLEEFDKASGINSYKKQLKDELNKGATRLNPEDPDFKADVDRLLTDDEYAEKVLGKNYKDYRKTMTPLGDFLDRCAAGPPDASVNDIKVFSRMAEKSDYMSKTPPHDEVYAKLRDLDHQLIQRTMTVLEENEELNDAMKQHILNGIHLDNILGLNDRQDGDVDEFLTVYGIQPEGATLDEDTLTKLFGSQFGTLLAENIEEVRAGTKTPTELKSFLADRMEIDMENNMILFKQEFPNPNYDPDDPDSPETILSQYPLFELGARARGIGASPTMEIKQTPFMAVALQQGTPDVNKWDKKAYRDYLTGQITSTKNRIKEAIAENRDSKDIKALTDELKELEETKKKVVAEL